MPSFDDSNSCSTLSSQAAKCHLVPANLKMGVQMSLDLIAINKHLANQLKTLCGNVRVCLTQLENLHQTFCLSFSLLFLALLADVQLILQNVRWLLSYKMTLSFNEAISSPSINCRAMCSYFAASEDNDADSEMSEFSSFVCFNAWRCPLFRFDELCFGGLKPILNVGIKP